MSTESKLCFRGALSEKTQLIAFFQFLDENTPKKYLGKPFYDPKSPEYGEHTPNAGYRPVNYGTYKKAGVMFAFNNTPVSKPTLFARLRSYANGVYPESKTTQAGSKPISYTKWEQTPCHKLIFERIGADPNSVRANIRAPDRYKIKYDKRDKYDYICYLAWKAMGQKTDLLDASVDQWRVVWGKDPKSPNMCHESVRDKQTGLIAYGYTTPLRWAMRNSHDATVQNLIILGDKDFNTKGLKRTAGQHKTSYFTEEQCLLLPKALDSVDTLVYSYFGILFGGRSIALRDLTPVRIDYEAHNLSVFESKVQKTIEKPIFEPETTFIRQYIQDFCPDPKKPLFARGPDCYNRELHATQKWFNQTPYPLSWRPTTHTAFKHTCVTQMSLHGVSMDSISDYIGTDPNTLRDFYRGGSKEKIQAEIGGMSVKLSAPTWRAFVIKLTEAFAQRYYELTGKQVTLPTTGGSS
ncbi:MAG: hypothetical protein FWE56_03725 [Candidatus Bathyarchaeota archaeon]|nr:hypothetical protein [Candidatus Termiticorpusculum sp.]